MPAHVGDGDNLPAGASDSPGGRILAVTGRGMAGKRQLAHGAHAQGAHTEVVDSVQGADESIVIGAMRFEDRQQSAHALTSPRE